MMELAATLQMTYIGVPMIYYGDETGTASQASRTDKSSLDQGNDPYNRGTFDWNISDWDMDMFNDYRNLIETRKDHKNALVYGAFEEVASHKDNKDIVYARYGSNDRSLVVLNNSGDKRIALSEKLCTFDNLPQGNYKVAVRAEADRSKTDSAGVDDQYADSIYTIAADDEKIVANAGDDIVAASTLYGGTYESLMILKTSEKQ